jgi:alginate O-acetyltransferase complex protein AlgJ
MLPRRWSTILIVITALALVPAVGATAAPRRPARPERIVGFDGLEYPSSPLVVQGSAGELFFGLELDFSCAWGGPLFEKGVRRLARLARVIEQSGRRVVFTVAPSKADIMRRHLPSSALPQGQCDAQGIKAQRDILNDFPDHNYVSARKAIAGDSRRAYWKTDQHWTEVGVSDWALELARALDPRLARRQRYRETTQTQVGYLNALRGVDTPETVRSVKYAGKVSVHTTKDSPSPMGSVATDMRWRSAPASKTWPGRTLLLGDSFTVVGLDSLAPLFRRGRFLWNNNHPDDVVAAAVADADTVVIEVVQFVLYGSTLGQASLRKAVRKAVRKHPSG